MSEAVNKLPSQPWTDDDFAQKPLTTWFDEEEHPDLAIPEMDIFAAASIGSEEKVRAWLERDHSLATKTNKGNWSAIMYASHSDHTGIIEILAKTDPACINQADDRGRTPLILSAMWGHDNAVKILLKHRACLEARDKVDCTALFHAVSMGHYETVKTLLNHGANPAPVQRAGRSTPLMVAASAGQEHMCLLLMSHMPVELIRLVNAVGDDAQSLACLNQHTDLAEMIHHYASGAIRSYLTIPSMPNRRTSASSSTSSNSSVFVDDDPTRSQRKGASISAGPKAVNKALRSSTGGVFIPDEDYELAAECLNDVSHPWLDLSSFLDNLNMGHYLPLFQEQEVDLAVFLTMSDQDFREVGITKVGARKKMVNAISRWHSCSFLSLVQKHGITPLEMAYADKLHSENEDLRAQVGKRNDELFQVRNAVATLRDKSNQVWYEMQPFIGKLPSSAANALKEMKRFADILIENR